MKINAALLSCLILASCATSQRTMNVGAPMPPLSDISSSVALTEIEPAARHDIILNNAAKKSCRFSSFQRKNTIGYELDNARHISFNASPSFDLWNPSDMDFKVDLKFTKALGGAANKRPDCTYGSGYYGLLPYAMNEGVNFDGLTDTKTIRGFVQDKLDERERRRIEREQKL